MVISNSGLGILFQLTVVLKFETISGIHLSIYAVVTFQVFMRMPIEYEIMQIFIIGKGLVRRNSSSIVKYLIRKIPIFGLPVSIQQPLLGRLKGIFRVILNNIN